jgi:hypothetical protein
VVAPFHAGEPPRRRTNSHAQAPEHSMTDRMPRSTRRALLCVFFLTGVCRGEEPPEAPDPPDRAAIEILNVFGNIITTVIEVRVNAAVAAPAAPDAALTPEQIAQVATELRPILVAELDLIRETCKLNKEQRSAIKAAGEAGLKELAKKYVEAQQTGSGQFSPRKAIHKKMLDALQKTLAAEQLSDYTAELSRREAHRKRVVILNMVAQLDHKLYLTAEQRDKIAASLESKWRAKWLRWPTATGHQFDQQYVPAIPDKLVTPHLSKLQSKIWDHLPKLDFDDDDDNDDWDFEAPEDDGWWDK